MLLNTYAKVIKFYNYEKNKLYNYAKIMKFYNYAKIIKCYNYADG